MEKATPMVRITCPFDGNTSVKDGCSSQKPSNAKIPAITLCLTLCQYNYAILLQYLINILVRNETNLIQQDLYQKQGLLMRSMGRTAPIDVRIKCKFWGKFYHAYHHDHFERHHRNTNYLTHFDWRNVHA